MRRLLLPILIGLLVGCDSPTSVLPEPGPMPFEGAYTLASMTGATSFGVPPVMESGSLVFDGDSYTVSIRYRAYPTMPAHTFESSGGYTASEAAGVWTIKFTPHLLAHSSAVWSGAEVQQSWGSMSLVWQQSD